MEPVNGSGYGFGSSHRMQLHFYQTKLVRYCKPVTTAFVIPGQSMTSVARNVPTRKLGGLQMTRRFDTTVTIVYL